MKIFHLVTGFRYKQLLKIMAYTISHDFAKYMQMSNRAHRSLYWQSVVNEIEQTAKLRLREERIKKYDFFPVLPKKLQKRVAKIIPFDYPEDPLETVEKKQEVRDVDEVDELKIQPATEVYNESTCSLIERKEKEFPQFELNLEYTVEKKAARKKPENWCSKFVCAERKDRVKWKSKIYQMEKNIWERPLDEQAEELTEASAERFTEWINALGSKTDKEMTKEQLKSLFSIEGNAKLLASIQTDPKEVHAIAKAVADRWQMPEIAIELKYEDYINMHLKKAPLSCNKIAFGRTIPYNERPWVRGKDGVTIETIYPDVLRSGEHLFSGIAHLRSTKALIEHCKKKPNVARPRYLVDNGYFKTTSEAVSEQEVPLFDLLKIK